MENEERSDETWSSFHLYSNKDLKKKKLCCCQKCNQLCQSEILKTFKTFERKKERKKY